LRYVHAQTQHTYKTLQISVNMKIQIHSLAHIVIRSTTKLNIQNEVHHDGCPACTSVHSSSSS